MRSCCKLFWCFKMYLKPIFFERYLINFWDLLTRISLPIHCFSFSPVQTPMHPPPTSPPPHRLVATVELTPYTHTSYPISIIFSTPHLLKSLMPLLWSLHSHIFWPHLPGPDEMGGLQAELEHLWSGPPSTALVWFGERRPGKEGAGRRPETETRFGAEWPSSSPILTLTWESCFLNWNIPLYRSLKHFPAPPIIGPIKTFCLLRQKLFKTSGWIFSYHWKYPLCQI